MITNVKQTWHSSSLEVVYKKKNESKTYSEPG